MPANKKYLTIATDQKVAKIISAIPLSFIVLALLYNIIVKLAGDYKIATATFSWLVFPVWIALMIFPFLFHNGFKCLALYAGIAFAFLIITLAL